MAKWSGFTEEELNKFRSSHTNSDDDKNNEDGIGNNNQKPRPAKLGSRRQPRGSNNTRRQTNDQKNAMVKKQETEPSKLQADVLSDTRQQCVPSPRRPSATLKVDIDSLKYEIVENTADNKTTEEQLKHNDDDDDDDACDRKLSGFQKDISLLQDFEKRQKQMEQENAKRKALLLNAIKDRQKRTVAESKKLDKIQEELNRLDMMLTSGVAILRNQIETASLEFNEAQKRYDKAEKEFVEAKMDLFSKMERKEQLTEYLCTIIEQNEVRKAKKLEDLMRDLELDTLLEECKENGMGPILPQLCSLSDVSYSCCATIKPPTISTNKKDINGNGKDILKENLKNSSGREADLADKNGNNVQNQLTCDEQDSSAKTATEQEGLEDSKTAALAIDDKSKIINSGNKVPNTTTTPSENECSPEIPAAENDSSLLTEQNTVDESILITQV